MRYATVGGCLLLWGLAGSLVTFGQARFAAGAEPTVRLIFTLVANPDEKAATVEIEDHNAPGKKIRVLKQPILDQSAIASAEVIKIHGGNAVSLKMTNDGAVRLKEATSHNVNRHLAIIFDGQVIFTPVIRDPLEGAVLITGKDPGLTDKEATAIVEAVQKSKASSDK